MTGIEAKRGARNRSRGRKFWLLAACAGAAMAAPALAQTESEEIIVTATQRSTSLQDVAVSVTPVTAGLLEKSGVRDLQDLTSLAPSLQFNVSENETSATARLRGIGTQGSNPGLESAVGIFIDGVYRARNGVALTDLGEVSQIEVLRGPQGTLFGRNTSAGLISVRTAGPSMDSFSANFEATYGDYNETRLAGSVTGPLIEDKLAGRVFAARSTRDGFMDVYDGAGGVTDVNDRDLWTVRGQALWTPTNDIDVRFIADYTERDETCCAAAIISPEELSGNPFATSPAFGTGAVTLLPFGTGRTALVASLGGYGPDGIAGLRGGDIEERIGYADRGFDQDLEDSGVSAEVTWDLGEITLTSVSSYRNWEAIQGIDGDYSALDIIYRPADEDNGFGFETITQEFRLAGQAGPLDWLVGLFYADETLDRREVLRTGADYGAYFAALDSVVGGAPAGSLYNALALTPVGAGYVDEYEQSSESIALFTHNIWALDDKTDVTFGLRFTHEEKELKADFNTDYSGQGAFLATVQGLAFAQTGNANAFDSFATCNFAAGAPAPALAPAFALMRNGYCAPWLRNDLDAIGYDQSREEDEWSGIVSIARDLTDQMRAYASYSRGYKGGGFNLDRDFRNLSDPDTSFEGEFVDAYELGLKTAWFGGDLILNGAAFYNEYENFQLNTFNGIQFVVTSVPEVTSLGAELDAIWSTPVEGLSYQGGLAYTLAEYGDDTGWVAANANPITGELTLANLPNARLTNAPMWTVTNAFTYERPLFADRALGLAYLDFRYVSEQNTGSDLRQSKVQPEYVLVNGRVGLATPDERYTVELWGRNLTDEAYAQVIFDPALQAGTNGPTQGAFLGDPRTYGVTLRARY